MNKTPGYKASVSTDSCNTVLVAQTPSHLWLFVTPRTAAHQASLSLTISWSLPKFMSIKSVMPSNHLILCPLLLLPSIFPSIRVFSDELALHFASGGQSIGASVSVSVLPMSIQGWFPLRLTGLISLQSEGLPVQGTLQHHSSKSSAIRPSNPTAGHTHQGNQSWKRYMYPNVHHSTIYNSQDMEAS